MNSLAHTLTYDVPSIREIGGRRTFARARAGRGFLRLVLLALSLSVVTMIEPSPGDIGIAVLLLFGFLFDRLSWKQLPILPLTLLSLFILANAVSLYFAVDLAAGASHGLITLFMMVLWLFIVGVMTQFHEEGLRTVMSGYAIGGTVSAALALLAYAGLLTKLGILFPYLNGLGLDNTLLYFGERLKGFFKDPNVFAPYLVVVTGYGLLRLQTASISPLLKTCWAASSLISALGVLLCFSRAAWANYIVTIAVFLLLNTLSHRTAAGVRRNLIYFLLGSLMVSAAVAYTVTRPRVSDFAANRSEMQTYDDDRFEKHSEALQLGFDHPLGVGPGQSPILLGGFNSHSLFLSSLADTGIIGFLALTSFIIATLIRSLVLSQRSGNQFQQAMFALVAAALLGTLLNSLVIDSIHWRHFWLLLGMGWMPRWSADRARRIAKW